MGNKTIIKVKMSSKFAGRFYTMLSNSNVEFKYHKFLWKHYFKSTGTVNCEIFISILCSL